MSSAGDSPGDGVAAGGIRASDAERDATLERLSQATGDGRLTLEEFSQRMERASTARTRAELDRLVADLPVPATGTAVAQPAQATPTTYHIRPIGGLRVTGPWRMGRHVVVLSLVGGTRVEAGPKPGPGAPTVHVRAFSLVGGVRVRRSRDA